MQTQRAVSAGGVIVDEAGNVVLTARRSFKGVLQWGLPKGTVEEGEMPPEAALREAREETGLEVELIRPLTTIDYWFVAPARDGNSGPIRVHKFVHYFLMRPVGGNPENHDWETEAVTIVAPAEAIEIATFDNEKGVIREALGDGG